MPENFLDAFRSISRTTELVPLAKYSMRAIHILRVVALRKPGVWLKYCGAGLRPRSKTVIPSVSRGIPWKLPQSFRNGIPRLTLGMTGAFFALQILFFRHNQTSRALRIYSKWQWLRQLRKFPRSPRSGRPFPKQPGPSRARKKLRPQRKI